MSAVKMAWYRNSNSKSLKLEIGTAPGSPPLTFEVDAGALFEGPANYAKFFKRQGCLPADAPGAAKAEETQPELAGLAKAPSKPAPEPEPLPPTPEPAKSEKPKKKSKGG